MHLDDLDLLAFGHTLQLVGTVYQDTERAYLLLFPGERTDLPVETLELSQDDWVKLVRQLDLLETEVLVQASDGTLAKVVLRKSARHIEQNVSWRVYARDKYSCRYCGATGVPLTVDHLVCWENGGPSSDQNLVATCRTCNRVRGNLPYAEWLESAHYRKVSQRLSAEVRAANEALVATLSNVPLRLHRQSR